MTGTMPSLLFAKRSSSRLARARPRPHHHPGSAELELHRERREDRLLHVVGDEGAALVQPHLSARSVLGAFGKHQTPAAAVWLTSDV